MASNIANNICYLVLIGCLTVGIDPSNYKLLVIRQVKWDIFGAAIAKLSNKQGCFDNIKIVALGDQVKNVSCILPESI